MCRGGFTREYGRASNGEQRVETGQQARPFRGSTRSYSGLCMCRGGFTREYGSADNGERRVEIGQQAWPIRG
ncbi:hypothetical protein [Pseudomonas sp.]|uniref:hypothetical protein n=1 Tax=Pseudomonas sp. TaxID=306 RepID=UPI0029C0CB61|nr:hypothetical protein [Pseudomonas sp.]